MNVIWTSKHFVKQQRFARRCSLRLLRTLFFILRYNQNRPSTHLVVKKNCSFIFVERSVSNRQPLPVHNKPNFTLASDFFRLSDAQIGQRRDCPAPALCCATIRRAATSDRRGDTGSFRSLKDTCSSKVRSSRTTATCGIKSVRCANSYSMLRKLQVDIKQMSLALFWPLSK